MNYVLKDMCSGLAGMAKSTAETFDDMANGVSGSNPASFVVSSMVNNFRPEHPWQTVEFFNLTGGHWAAGSAVAGVSVNYLSDRYYVFLRGGAGVGFGGHIGGALSMSSLPPGGFGVDISGRHNIGLSASPSIIDGMLNGPGGHAVSLNVGIGSSVTGLGTYTWSKDCGMIER